MNKAKAPFIFLLGIACFLIFFNGNSQTKNDRVAKTLTVEIVHMQFVPAELKVNKGDKIVFLNKDMVTHNVTEASGKTWHSPDILAGKSWSMTATKSAAYYCAFHPVMKGKITVNP